MPCAGQALDKDTILAHPCDVLIPAAIGGVLDETTAKDVQVRLAVAQLVPCQGIHVPCPDF